MTTNLPVGARVHKGPTALSTILCARGVYQTILSNFHRKKVKKAEMAYNLERESCVIWYDLHPTVGTQTWPNLRGKWSRPTPSAASYASLVANPRWFKPVNYDLIVALRGVTVKGNGCNVKRILCIYFFGSCWSFVMVQIVSNSGIDSNKTPTLNLECRWLVLK